jgi:Co/Zn/Cd efflux system component
VIANPASRSSIFNLFLKAEVIFVKDLLFAVLALVSAGVAVWSFLSYQKSANTTMFIVAIVGVLATLAFGGVFLAKRMSNKEEIHITE